MESEKREIRKIYKIKRDSIEFGDRQEKNEAIANTFLSLPEYKSAKTVMFYASRGSEVETKKMIEDALSSGKKVVLPVSDMQTKKLIPSEIKNFENELGPGVYSILEPKPEFIRPVKPETIDLVVVPGVVFDKQGFRLGYGAGFYDRFLKRMKAFKVGLAYQCQISAEPLPRDPWDLPVNTVITE